MDCIDGHSTQKNNSFYHKLCQNTINDIEYYSYILVNFLDFHNKHKQYISLIKKFIDLFQIFFDIC